MLSKVSDKTKICLFEIAIFNCKSPSCIMFKYNFNPNMFLFMGVWNIFFSLTHAECIFSIKRALRIMNMKARIIKMSIFIVGVASLTAD